MSKCSGKTKGEIRSGKVQRAQPYPSVPGFTVIPAWSRGANPWNQLSPMKLGPVDVIENLPLRPGFELSGDKTYTTATCYIFENYFQSGKIYRVDLIDGSNPITVENLKSSFWERRAKIFQMQTGVRHALPKAKYGLPISSYYLGEIMDYITSRHKIYVTLYQSLIIDHPVFLKLKEKFLTGENLLIVGPDDHDENKKLTLELLDTLIDNPKLIYGHELVICATLLGRKYKFN